MDAARPACQPASDPRDDDPQRFHSPPPIARIVKVLYLNPSAKLGGAERSLLDLMWSIRRTRPDWQLTLLAGEQGDLVERSREIGIATKVLPMPRALARLGDAAAGGPAGGGAFRLCTLIARMNRAIPAVIHHVATL